MDSVARFRFWDDGVQHTAYRLSRPVGAHAFECWPLSSMRILAHPSLAGIRPSQIF